MLKALLKDEQGLETVEYAVMGALLIVGALLTGQNLFAAVKSKFDDLAELINS